MKDLDYNKIIEGNFKGLEDFIKDKDILQFYNDLIIECIKYYGQEMHYPTEKVSRFEVIDHTKEMIGRVYVKYDISIDLSFQDDGKTLKVFVDDRTNNKVKNKNISFTEEEIKEALELYTPHAPIEYLKRNLIDDLKALKLRNGKEKNEKTL